MRILNHEDETVTNTSRRRVYLLRHGHVDYFDPKITGSREVELTSIGRTQASAAAELLQKVEFDRAICSGLPRTLQTAQIILNAQKTTPELETNSDFEEIQSGWVTGVTREELAVKISTCFDDAHAPEARFLPDGETFATAEQRIARGFQSLVANDGWKSALIVAHEGVNRILLGHLSGGGLQSIGAFEQDLACINIIDLIVESENGRSGHQIKRSIIKAMNFTAYDHVKHTLPRTSLEHLFEVDLEQINSAT